MRQGLRLALKDLTDHLPVVVYRYQLLPGHRPHMLYISEAVERLTGSTAQAVMDNPQIFFQRIHPDDLSEFIAADQKSWETKTDFSLEFRFYTPDNSLHWLYANSSPFELSNGKVVYHGFIEDITERKLADARIKKVNRCCSKFLILQPPAFFW